MDLAPWDPDDVWAPVPFSRTEFKIFENDSSDDESGLFEKWTPIPDESDFEDE